MKPLALNVQHFPTNRNVLLWFLFVCHHLPVISESNANTGSTWTEHETKETKRLASQLCLNKAPLSRLR